MSAKHWALLLLTAALFGSSFLFIKIAVVEVPPLSLAAARVAIAAVFMVAVLLATGGRLPAPGRDWLPLFVLGGLTAALPYFAVAWGQTRISSSLGGILFATIPIFTMFIAPFIVKEERLTGAKLLGVSLAFVGVILAIGPQAFGGLTTQLAGAAVTLSAALSYALGNIYARLRRDLSPMVMATGQLVTGSVILVPLSLLLDQPVVLSLSAGVAASILAVALLSTALPVLLMFWLVRHAGATRASILAFFIPVAAVVLGASVLGEVIPAATFAGFAVIVVGALLATGTISRLIPRTA